MRARTLNRTFILRGLIKNIFAQFHVKNFYKAYPKRHAFQFSRNGKITVAKYETREIFLKFKSSNFLQLAISKS